MTLVEQIQIKFIEALKAKDENAKRALSNFKSKLTEAQKAQKNVELNEVQSLQILNKTIAQRQQSFTIYSTNGRQDLADVEQAEIDILSQFLPPQMSDSEIAEELILILDNIPYNLSEQARSGKAIGMFNKAFPGQADIDRLKKIIDIL